MQIIRLLLVWCLCRALLPAAGPLDIYFVDVEGGQATLIVSPSGESLLVDAGWPGFEGRDAERIVSTARQAGVRRIDHLLMTHYHTDHVGGIPQLAERIPIAHYIDHGSNTETGPRAEEFSAAYQKAVEKARRTIVKPGDAIPIGGLRVQVISARGELIQKPLPGAGAENPLCASAERRAEDKTENGKSVGILVTYGKFRFINLADLTWNLELDLVCPVNRVGTADVYLVTHHGMNMSGPAAIVHALRPRVAIMNNGAKKGGTPQAWQVIKDSPGLEDLWQLHYSLPGGREHNVEEAYIANLEESCQGYGLKLSAQADSTFTILNARNSFSKTYKPPRR